jgi:hypothetical protein
MVVDERPGYDARHVQRCEDQIQSAEHRRADLRRRKKLNGESTHDRRPCGEIAGELVIRGIRDGLQLRPRVDAMPVQRERTVRDGCQAEEMPPEVARHSALASLAA